MGDPRMTKYLGGPETPEKIRQRHHRYVALKDPGQGAMLVITAGPNHDPVGSIGYWEKERDGETVWETGWSVLLEHQGRGIATAAIPLVVERARATGLRRSIHAFPSVDNGPSNAICRKAGFTLVGAFDFEYPPGHPLRCNDWVLDPP
jgi:RimJ/RimL family protein N-acetyltransferase